MGQAFKSTVCRDVHLSRWFYAAEPPDVERLHEELRRLALTHERFSILLIVSEGVPLSGDESRRAAARMLRALRRHVSSVAIVIEGDGFGSAAVRAMFAGIALLLRTSFRWTVKKTVAQAASWLHVESGAASDDQLLDAAAVLQSEAQ